MTQGKKESNQAKDSNEKKEETEPVENDSSEISSAADVSKEEIDSVIRKRVYAAMALGLAPIPLVDLIGLGAIQIDLVRVLAKKHDVVFRKNIVKTLIAALMGGILPVGSAPLFASVVKFVPFVGLTTGAVSLSLLGGASTYAVGKVFEKHFASGGTLLDVETEKIKTGFKEQYKKGKEFVASKKTKTESDDTNVSEDPTESV